MIMSNDTEDEFSRFLSRTFGKSQAEREGAASTRSAVISGWTSEM
jgi:hypothetical protein